MKNLALIVIGGVFTALILKRLGSGSGNGDGEPVGPPIPSTPINLAAYRPTPGAIQPRTPTGFIRGGF